MSVSTTNTSVTYTAGGTLTGPYAVTFDYDTKSTDIKLLLDGVASTDFTIDGSNDLYTGTTIAAGVALKIYRETGKTQDQTFPPNTTPAPEDVAEGLDKLTLITQELEAGISDISELPDGGTDGQFLAKASDTDGDAEWVVAPTGGGGGVPAAGTTGQVLAKASETDYDTEWVEPTGGVTPGPSQGWGKPDGAVGDGVTDDSAAFQAHFDAGKSLYLADGTYRLDTGIQIKYKGTVWKGESMGGVQLNFSNMVGTGKAISIIPDPYDLPGRMPGASTTGNNWPTIEQMFIRGPGRLTASYGIWTQPNDDREVPEITWQGDAMTMRNLWIQEFGTGAQWRTPNKTFLENCLFKQCEIGLEATNDVDDVYSTGTCNTLLIHHIHITECTTGILTKGADAVITMGDVSVCDKMINQQGGNLDISGGQLEQCVTVLQCDGGRAAMRNATMLSTEGDVPIILTGRAAVQTANLEVFFASQAGVIDNTTPLIWLTENTCSAFGTPSFSMFTFSSYLETKYQVRLWTDPTPAYQVNRLTDPIGEGEQIVLNYNDGAPGSITVTYTANEPDVAPVIKANLENIYLLPSGATHTGFTTTAGAELSADSLDVYQMIHLSPFPYRGGSLSPAQVGGEWTDATRGHLFYAIDEANDQGDDIRSIIKSGISTTDDVNPYTRVSLIRPNQLTSTQQGTFMDMSGIERYFMAEGTATAARTVRLPKISLMGASATNGHVTTIVDKDGNAGTNNITLEMNSVDVSGPAVLNGSAVISSDFGTATFYTEGTDWYRTN